MPSAYCHVSLELGVGGGVHYGWSLQSKVLVLQTGVLTARKEVDSPGQSSTARHRADRALPAVLSNHPLNLGGYSAALFTVGFSRPKSGIHRR